MKKFVSVFLVLMLLLSALPMGLFSITASAATDGYYTYTVSNGEATITGLVNGTGGSISIPSTIGGYPVTKIGDYAFGGEALCSIIFNDGIIEIGDQAFYYCKNLQEVILPDSLVTIGQSAFFGCTNLASVDIPQNTITIGEYAFYDCIKLSVINIPDSVTTIGSNVFYNTAFYNNEANWSENVLYINNHLIQAREILSGEYTVNVAVKTIAGCAFRGCTALTGVNFPDSIVEIGYAAFENCEKIETIVFPEKCKIIRQEAFARCSNLKSVVFNKNLILIDDNAFPFFSTKIQCIFYTGSAEEWQKVHIGTNNSFGNRIHYNGQGHQESDWGITKNPTCAERGEKVVTCTICGIVLKTEKIALLTEHRYTNVCDPDCNVCGYIRVIEHEFEWIIDKSNTCVVDGTKHEECTICHATRNENTVIPASGAHNFRWIIDKYNDCHDTGIKHEECTVCHAKRNENTIIPATGKHTYDHGCDTDCNVCGETRTTSHKYTNNCDASCNVCGATRTPPHSYKTSVTKATTSKNGKITKTCSGCKKKVTTTIYYAKSFSLSKTSFTYNGKVQTPTVTVKDAKGKVIDPKYYTLSYSSGRKNVGTYKVTIKLKGNYSGSKTLSYKINPISISKCKVSISGTSYTYNGKVIKPSVKVLSAGGSTLKNGTHYTVSYSKGCKAPGTYKVTVKMKGTYSGSKSFTYKINPISISKCKVSISGTSYYYNGKVIKPSVKVQTASGSTLKNGTHYTVSYSSGCKNPGTYKVVVKMKGTYSGSKTFTYTIKPQIKISTCQVSLSSTAYTYNGKTQTPSVKVVNAEGTTLKNGTHYTVSYSSGRKNIGTYKVTVKMKGAYTGSKTLTYKINPISISKCKVSISATSYTYDGKAKTPSITVKTASGTTLKKDTHYTVSYSSGRINVGTYKVVVKMKGTYSGSQTFTFDILPPKTSINSLVENGKTLKVDFAKKTVQVTGYEIQYATDADFADALTMAIADYNTTSATITELKSGATYYVRVRTYKTVNGVNYYSGWSSVQSINTTGFLPDDNAGWIPGWY